jgi:hypothetical protein
VIYAVGNLIGVSVGSKSQNTATVCVMILFWCANGVTLKVGQLCQRLSGSGEQYAMRCGNGLKGV